MAAAHSSPSACALSSLSARATDSLGEAQPGTCFLEGSPSASPRGPSSASPAKQRDGREGDVRHSLWIKPSQGAGAQGGWHECHGGGVGAGAYVRVRAWAHTSKCVDALVCPQDMVWGCGGGRGCNCACARLGTHIQLRGCARVPSGHGRARTCEPRLGGVQAAPARMQTCCCPVLKTNLLCCSGAKGSARVPPQWAVCPPDGRAALSCPWQYTRACFTGAALTPTTPSSHALANPQPYL